MYSYSTKRLLGKGAFAQVFLGCAKTKEGDILHKVAVKRIDKATVASNIKVRTLLQNEVVILRLLKGHAHIVSLLDYFEDKNYMHLVLEYCDAGDLAAYLKTHTVLQEPMLQNFLKQLANGVQHMRSLHIVHRDLKPQNILLQSCSTQPFDVLLKITDFGFACRLTAQDLTKTFCGSPLHMAPEVLAGHTYDPKIDLWSLGTIAYQMGTGTTPYRAQTLQELRQKLVQAQQYRQPLLFPGHVSERYKDLVQRLLFIDPQQRISFTDFYQHPFLQGETFYSAVDSGSLSLPPPAVFVAAPLHYVVVEQPLTALEEWLDTADSLTSAVDDIDQRNLRHALDTAVRQARLLLTMGEHRWVMDECLGVLRNVALSDCLALLHGTVPCRTTMQVAVKYQDCVKYCSVQMECSSRLGSGNTSDDNPSGVQPDRTTAVTAFVHSLLDRADQLVAKGRKEMALTMHDAVLCLLALVADARLLQPRLLALHRRIHTMTTITFGQIGCSVLKTDSHHLTTSAGLALLDSPNSPTTVGTRPINIPQPNSVVGNGSLQSSLNPNSPIRFCGLCGTQFMRGFEKYCVMCGTPRGSI